MKNLLPNRAWSRYVTQKGWLTVECDERWSFVGHQGNQPWVWRALDRELHELIGVAIGADDEATARQSWEALLAGYRQCAGGTRDLWAASAGVVLTKGQRPVGKASGQMSPRERLNNPLR